MRALRALPTLTFVALITVVLAACTSTLTKIGVDTDRRTVYLTGTVDNAEMRSRAEQIARSVTHVSAVVNNLTVRAQ